MLIGAQVRGEMQLFCSFNSGIFVSRSRCILWIELEVKCSFYVCLFSSSFCCINKIYYKVLQQLVRILYYLNGQIDILWPTSQMDNQGWIKHFVFDPFQSLNEFCGNRFFFSTNFSFTKMAVGLIPCTLSFL